MEHAAVCSHGCACVVVVVVVFPVPCRNPLIFSYRSFGPIEITGIHEHHTSTTRSLVRSTSFGGHFDNSTYVYGRLFVSAVLRTPVAFSVGRLLVIAPIQLTGYDDDLIQLFIFRIMMYSAKHERF